MTAAPVLGSDRARAALVAVFAVGQIVSVFTPQIFGLEQSVITQVQPYEHALTPADYAFGIWGLIYAGALAFALWQLMPRNLANPLSRRIGWLAAAMYAANTLWQIAVPFLGVDWLSSALLAAELGLGIAALGRVRDLGRPLRRSELWVAAAPLGVLTGWVTAATFVNISTSALWAGGWPFDAREVQVAGALLVGAVIFSAFAVNATRSPFQTGSILWALLAIALRNLGEDLENAIAGVALGAMGVVLLALWAPRWRFAPAPAPVEVRT